MPEIVRYRVDDDTVAQFEIEPVPGFHPAGAGSVAGRVRESADAAIEAARVLLDRVKEIAPDEVHVRFGVKVTGTADWIIARASTEGNFEITLTWQPGIPTPAGENDD
ncbi:MAG TPA: CU044_2847 family protein [Kribbellaceae bacterium]|nr:CU044_2847 family protein [Kribbellaceae bacterium]